MSTEKKKKESESKAVGSTHAAAKILGHRGGKVGGPARASKLSASERKRIALEGARARWRKRPASTS